MAALLLCVTLLAAACRPEKSPPAAPVTTATTAPPTTAEAPTTTTLDVSTPPSTAQLQDPAYWNAVLAALNHVVGDVFRQAVTSGKVEPSTVDALHQVYGAGVFPNHYDSLVEVAGGKGNGILIPPGDAEARVTGVMKADSGCVALSASLYYGKVNPTVPDSSIVVKLTPRGSPQDSPMNPTPWKIDEQFNVTNPTEGDHLCAD